MPSPILLTQSFGGDSQAWSDGPAWAWLEREKPNTAHANAAQPIRSLLKAFILIPPVSSDRPADLTYFWSRCPVRQILICDRDPFSIADPALAGNSKSTATLLP